MATIRVQSSAAPITLEVKSTQPATARVTRANPLPAVAVAAMPGPQGAQGPAGPDPWLEPIQNIEAGGALVIDYSLGKHVRLTMTADITVFSVIGWPAPNRIARLTLEILNTGDFGILAWPEGTLWQSGSGPDITRGAGARDRIILSTTDAGASIYGDPVGFDYR